MPSSVVRRFEYAPDTQTLRVIFVSGAVYDYFDVPPQVADAFAAVFGLIWGTAIRLHLILQVVNPIDPGTLATEILIFGVAMGVVVAPCFALFRGISSLIGTVMLDWFDRS